MSELIGYLSFSDWLIFVSGCLVEGKALFLCVSHLSVWVFQLHHKLENTPPFPRSGSRGNQRVKIRQHPFRRCVCRPPKLRHTAEYLQHFHIRKLANTVKDDKQLKLQRALGPLRLILILLGSANLFWVCFILCKSWVQENSAFIIQDRGDRSFLFLILPGFLQ